MYKEYKDSAFMGGNSKLQWNGPVIVASVLFELSVPKDIELRDRGCIKLTNAHELMGYVTR